MHFTILSLCSIASVFISASFASCIDVPSASTISGLTEKGVPCTAENVVPSAVSLKRPMRLSRRRLLKRHGSHKHKEQDVAGSSEDSEIYAFDDSGLFVNTADDESANSVSANGVNIDLPSLDDVDVDLSLVDDDDVNSSTAQEEAVNPVPTGEVTPYTYTYPEIQTYPEVQTYPGYGTTQDVTNAPDYESGLAPNISDAATELDTFENSIEEAEEEDEEEEDEEEEDEEEEDEEEEDEEEEDEEEEDEDEEDEDEDELDYDYYVAEAVAEAVAAATNAATGVTTDTATDTATY
ncbi:hypothetical protein [Parasitella parasitica]|uniref:Uncharacterized protein n=1 Tax=Parasitella parasitica TaxID=35722 RepID=A0A0B7N467_9FUNG|nr:hypothetical protein [Parasitella parasitica]